MSYGSRSLLKLKVALCKDCFGRSVNWTDHIYSEWLKYLKGQPLELRTHKTLQYHFKKHPCYNKIAKIRKNFKKTKTHVKKPITNYPWLLGLYYADGFVRNKSQLAFALSMHEELIEDRVCRELKEILTKNANVRKEFIGNMRQVRIHSTELCDYFPDKYNEQVFLKLWNKFTRWQKLEFIAGFIDGDGSCAFDVGITAIQAYSKELTFLLKKFYELLFNFGYVSLLDNRHKLYISPKVGLILKKHIVKKDVKRPYNGSVDVQRAFQLLKKGQSVCSIAKEMSFNKKTVNLALRQVYGYDRIKKLFNR